MNVAYVILGLVNLILAAINAHFYIFGDHKLFGLIATVFVGSIGIFLLMLAVKTYS